MTYITKKIVVLLLLGFSILMSCDTKKDKNQETPEKKQIVSEGYITASDSLDIFYQVKGNDNDTLVIVHGGPGMDSEYMVADFEPLSKKYTLIYYDQRGGGRSSLPKDIDKLHIDKHVSDLEMLRNYFGLDQLTLIGHSFGPMVLAKYAIAHPDNVSKMVFLGPVPPMQEDFGARYGSNLTSKLNEEELQKMGKAYQELIEGNNPKAGCQAYWNIALKPRLAVGLPVSIVKGDCCAASGEAIRYGMQVTNPTTFGSLGNWDLRSQLSNVTAPTLILHGIQEAIPMDMVEEWSVALPNAALIKVPDAGHFTYAERPDIVWPAIEKFLAK